MVNNWKTIEMSMHKTKISVVVPLTKKALRFLPEYNIKSNTPIFRVISNQKTNEILRKSIAKCNIKKAGNISFHCARHSFATNALHKGVPLKYVSQILGHTEVKTTELYTRLNKYHLIESASILNH